MYGDKQAYNMQKCRTGTDFENFIVTLLTQYGFDARKTGRDDKGVDIIATKNVYKDKPPLKFFIQCKFWKSTIGIGPINEVIGGALYRGGDGHKVIITNNRLTGEAKAYAKKMGVEYISEFEFNELALCEKHQNLLGQTELVYWDYS